MQYLILDRLLNIYNEKFKCIFKCHTIIIENKYEA